MRKHIPSALVVAIVITLLTYNATSRSEKEQSDIENEIQVYSFDAYFNYLKETEIRIAKENEKAVEVLSVEVEQRPYIEGISLDDSLLEYIWNVSIENDFSYELILAFARVESNFTVDAKSKTSDSGLFQIHRPTGKWISEELGLLNYDLMDARTSVDFCVWYLTYLRDRYRDLGMLEEDAFYYIITSYNRGENGARSYIRKHGMNVKYTEKVIYYKGLYEQGGETE